MGKLIDDASASPEVQAVFEDIRQTRKTDFINNLWRAIANHPPTLRRIWQNVKEVMGAPSALDPLTKELIYVAISINNNCEYCQASHTAAARARGVTETQLQELYAIVALANETNRLAIAYKVEVDARFRDA
jgi:AhpD family alkylhydroperoxidase